MTKKSKKSPSGSTTPEEKEPVGVMKSVYTELTEGIQSCDKRCEEIGVCMSLVHERLEALANLTKNLVMTCANNDLRLTKLQDWTRRVDIKHDQQIQKLLDRVIEMAMVNQGKPVEATAHRSKSDNTFSNEDSWSIVSGENPDDVWPPAGCDSMELWG